MAHLWVKGASRWMVRPLRGQHVTLWRPPGYARTNPELSWARSLMNRLALHFHRNREAQTWNLTTLDSNVLVNGAPCYGGCVLRDRDSIEVPDEGPMLFASQTPPIVERFPGPGEPAICARCGSYIGQDGAAVACPGCDAWHHQSDEEPCWVAGPTCANCKHPTDLNVDYPWRPDEE